MHILFIHKNFPAQFGHVAASLSQRVDIECSVASEVPADSVPGLNLIQYQPHGGTTAKTHYCCRTFENQIRASHGLHEALKKETDLRPDLIVSHSGFVSPLFLRNLYDCPVINYFEYFYRMTDSDLDFRPEFPLHELQVLRVQARNAMLLLDLENCDAGYSPTAWQRSCFPSVYQPKIRQIFDGIDTNFWKPRDDRHQQVANATFHSDTKIVTYVSRGLESMRGFDIFMRIAGRLCAERSDVVFLVVGEDRTCYGDESTIIGRQTFKEWVLSQDEYDLDRIRFLGRVSTPELAQILARTDLHIYLTVPFVLSWSLINAMAAGATVLASQTAPVQEFVQHGTNGLLADFFDVDRFVELAHQVLNDPPGHRQLGEEARRLVTERYSLDRCLAVLLDFYQQVCE
jgi:glycosyltransferase involved in cell wall biosynthesis